MRASSKWFIFIVKVRESDSNISYSLFRWSSLIRHRDDFEKLLTVPLPKTNNTSVRVPSFSTKIQRRSSVDGFLRFPPSNPMQYLHRLTKIRLYVESKYIIYIWRFSFFKRFISYCCHFFMFLSVLYRYLFYFTDISSI